ncbi:MAG: 2-C-methyl-D-erythritol 4-phosphate cytidylyltransferase, partial [Rikenellaceae bacterium]
KTVSRDQLWQAQTPQISTLAKLKSAIEHALADDIIITDEASALEYINEDEYVEVTPRCIRLRKIYLSEVDRKRYGSKVTVNTL